MLEEDLNKQIWRRKAVWAEVVSMPFLQDLEDDGWPQILWNSFESSSEPSVLTYDHCVGPGICANADEFATAGIIVVEKMSTDVVLVSNGSCIGKIQLQTK